MPANDLKLARFRAYISLCMYLEVALPLKTLQQYKCPVYEVRFIQ